MKRNNKGFTLVELLAVIVILAIIMVIAIPTVLETMENARRKTFGEYVDKVASLSQKQLSEDQMLGEKSFTDCTVYNVKTGLGLNNTGNYEGWVLINSNKNDIYVTLYNDNYVIIGYHYSDSSLKMDDYIQKKSNNNISKLTLEELCKNSSCSSCNVDGTTIDGDKTNTSNMSNAYVVSKTVMYIGSKLPSDVKSRSTPLQAMNDWQDIVGMSGAKRPFYLKHIIENDIIKESYVEFVVTPEMADANVGVKAGTFTLKGGIDESELTEKSIFESNKAILRNVFGSERCTDFTRYLYCGVPGLHAYAFYIGGIGADGDTHYCHVDSDGSSHCKWF